VISTFTLPVLGGSVEVGGVVVAGGVVVGPVGDDSLQVTQIRAAPHITSSRG
jgi:hypothetical protein